MRSYRGASIATVAAPALALAAITGVPTAGAASGVRYVALGDSYSSGVGAGNYYSSSGSCKRSASAYPVRWADSNSPASFTSVACSGATTSDVLSGQVSALSARTTLVSITIGGNDAGFPAFWRRAYSLGTALASAPSRTRRASSPASFPRGSIAPFRPSMRTRPPRGLSCLTTPNSTIFPNQGRASASAPPSAPRSTGMPTGSTP